MTSYILCATPRSGSTMLCDLLKSAGAGAPRSFYRRQSMAGLSESWNITSPGDAPEPGLDRTYLEAAIVAGRGEGNVFGMRLMYVSLAGMMQRIGALYPHAETDRARFSAAFGPCTFIHLSRRDKLAQAISLIKAEQSGLWHRYADGSDRERLAPVADAGYDPERLAQTRESLENDDASWRAWFTAQKIRPIRVVYEDLAASPLEILARILGALGLDLGLAERARVNTARLSDAHSADWTRRFREGQR